MPVSTQIQNNARTFPISDAHQQPPADARNGQGLPRQPCIKKLVELKFASWNEVRRSSRELTSTDMSAKDQMGTKEFMVIDYVMIKRADLKRVRNCKVTPGEAVVAQHRLLCMVLKIRQEKKRKPKTQKRIKIWTLKGDNIIEFQEKVIEKQVPQTGTAQENWQSMKIALLEAAGEVCVTTKGGRDEDLREAYKEAKREPKIALAKAKEEAWREWYEKMETKEEERIIYKVAKQRAQSRQDVGEISVIKDKDGVLLTDENKIKERWREYFSNLLNVENEWDPLQECPPVEGPLPDINEKEVEDEIKKMKCERATGCYGIPVDLLKHLGKDGIQMVTSLLQKVWDEEKMQAE
ncbi:uncharacterized protein LOC125038065 [Penaeus chinensis]|uniref:uncharacterized protein LOC125038065 n=1 Tax=Penaeus chinensis TaxID=139456 RepID=UPI001FB7462F|nr:uncharacterized protein LOC125038065 [Penaeus chinensis]